MTEQQTGPTDLARVREAKALHMMRLRLQQLARAIVREDFHDNQSGMMIAGLLGAAYTTASESGQMEFMIRAFASMTGAAVEVVQQEAPADVEKANDD